MNLKTFLALLILFFEGRPSTSSLAWDLIPADQAREIIGEMELSCRLPSPQRVPSSAAQVSSDVPVELVLRGVNSGACDYTAILEASRDQNPEVFLDSLRQANWNPCCISREIKKWLASNQREVRGILFGFEMGAAVGLGVGIGRELVVLAGEGDELQVAVVNYSGINFSLSLPAGASVIQGVVLDDCRKIDDYLGYFASAAFAGAAKDEGLSGVLPRTRPTGCNAVRLTSGLTTSLIGASESFYSKASPVVKIRGARVHAFAEFLRKANVSAAARANNERAFTDKSSDRAWYRAEDYIVKGCQDNIILQIGNYLSGNWRKQTK